MTDYTDTVPILRGHLEEIYVALDAARGYHVASDLATQFKNVGGTHRPSNLAKKLEKALDRVDGYLLMENDDELSEE